MELVHELTETMRAPRRGNHRRRLAIVVSLALLTLACLASVAYHLSQRGQRAGRSEAETERAPVAKARATDKQPAARPRPAGPVIPAASRDAASRTAPLADAGISTAHGLLRLTVTPPVSVLWNKRPLGQTPLEVSLPPGRHRLFLRSEHPVPVRLLRGVKIEPRETTVVSWKLAKGSLEIQAEPQAEVKINGRKRGVTPLSLELYEGVCQVRLFCSQLQKSYLKLVTIRPGKTSRVVHRFGE
jgi:hypothetical protein